MTELDDIYEWNQTQRKAELTKVATAMMGLLGKGGTEFLRSAEVTGLKRLAAQLFPAPDLTAMYDATQKRVRDQEEREPTLKEKADALFSTWPPQNVQPPAAQWAQDMAAIGGAIPADIEYQMNWYAHQMLAYDPEEHRVSAGPLGMKLHEALEAYVNSSSIKNRNRVVEEALWWAITPSMRARTSFLKTLVLNDRANATQKVEFGKLSAWCELASRLCEQRLQSEVLMREMTERLEEFKPPTEMRQEGKNRTFHARYTRQYAVPHMVAERQPPSYTQTGTRYPGEVTAECGCEEDVVCPTHQRAMSDGRAKCQPFHPVSAIDFTPDGGKCCRRCGQIFSQPTVTVRFAGKNDIVEQVRNSPLVVLPQDRGYRRQLTLAQGAEFLQAMAERGEEDDNYPPCPVCGILPESIEYPESAEGWLYLDFSCGDKLSISPEHQQAVFDPPDDVRRSMCQRCFTGIWYQDCPTGGWWIHDTHPSDDHDAEVDAPAARVTSKIECAGCIGCGGPDCIERPE